MDQDTNAVLHKYEVNVLSLASERSDHKLALLLALQHWSVTPDASPNRSHYAHTATSPI